MADGLQDVSRAWIGNSTMNGDIQAARKLLDDLRRAYRSLPRHSQAAVTHVLGILAQKKACAEGTG